MKISFLIHNIYGIGGTNRTVINLAEALAEQHDVEIVSVFRRMDATMLAVSGRVAVRPLVDLRRGRPDTRHPLRLQPSAVIPPSEEFARQYSALTDQRIEQFLQHSDADVVVGTRPGINLCVARFGRADAVRVAQEHMTHEMIPAEVRDAMREAYARIDAAVTVTRADRDDFRATTPIPGLRLEAIPNSVPAPAVAGGRAGRPIVMAAGRLAEIKRFDLLLHAFTEVVAQVPDARLRIYGNGPLRGELRSLVTALGLYNNVDLMGQATRLDAEWPKAAVAVVSSDKESFGMTVVEAMRCGVPVVSTACPYGPPEIIESGVDGVLVPVGDATAIADALVMLLREHDMRERMAQAALTASQRFDPAAIAARYEQLFEELLGQRRAEGTRRPRGLWSGTKRVVRRGLAAARLRRAAAPAAQVLADCVVEPSGAVTVRLPADAIAALGGSLLCRDRNDRAGEHDVVVPFRRVEDTGGWVATVPGGDTVLAEGRWNVYLAVRGRGPVRLVPGHLDLSALLRADQWAVPGPVVRRVPYRTQEGLLSIRSWVRSTLAEAPVIRYGEDGLHITTRLVGVRRDGTGARHVLRRRDPVPSELTFTGPVEAAGELVFHVPLEPLVRRRLTRRDDWDAYLDLGDGEPVRVARLMDDIAEKKRTYVYPAMSVSDASEPWQADEWPQPAISVTPYFNIDGNLALAVADKG